ncbi:MAG: hypothetical protein RLY37_770 [Verrucomicrobiota bacterium]|jgi:hypothetical protein
MDKSRHLPPEDATRHLRMSAASRPVSGLPLSSWNLQPLAAVSVLITNKKTARVGGLIGR